MFGLILPTRPVLAQPQMISQTQYAYTIPSMPAFSHLVLFLLPGNVLPPDVGAAIYIKFPGTSDFRLLGAIGMEKQSAIFKVNSSVGVEDGVAVTGEINGVAEVDMDAPEPGVGDPAAAQGDIMIGISIEPSVTLAPQLAALATSQQQQSSSAGAMTVFPAQQQTPSTKVLAQRIIKNAFNFLASFAAGGGGEEVVPLKSFESWWRKFERRIEVDPGFLERDEAG